ncbi:hypothetical protein [Roseomonas populi]|uniref:Phage tail protein n=1 Tax=Roseomonas populi TaxID=3121582 RepID=A0ABT1X3S4_9PROT|nr:hypothetical protein [Roseomonas pecuniae]MCR0982762.1 hypothetical protein [Roseomonas pecuniae]
MSDRPVPDAAARLLALLPAIHRMRDAALAEARGTRTGPLHQFVLLLAEVIAAIEENLDQLYDDQFIETCADWVVPYIGDLVGYLPIRPDSSAPVSRTEVANTIRHRRAKGTAVALEGVARDVTGRDAAVVEFRRRMAVTQHLNHRRPGIHNAALRDPTAMADPGGPFDTLAHGAELRGIDRGGRWNLMNVGCFLWPWRIWQLLDAAPGELDARRFTVSPLGCDMPLFNMPLPFSGRLSGPDEVASPLRLRGPAAEARAARSVRIEVGGVVQPFHLCDLSDTGGATPGWANMPSEGVALDPERGRIAFAAPPAGPVRVTHALAWPGLLGGGPYPREEEAAATIRVPAGAPDLTAALGAGPAQGVIEVAGSLRHAAPAAIAVAANRVLEIRAASGSRPVLDLAQPLALEGGEDSELVLDGFLVLGAGLEIPAQRADGQPNGLRRVTIRHCTLVPGLRLNPDGAQASPGAPSVTVEAPLTLALRNSIAGPIHARPHAALRISDSVLDAGIAEAPAIAAATGDGAGPSLWAFNATIRGRVAALALPLASNTLFLGPVSAERLQDGVVRFSFVPPGSRTPRRHACVSPAEGAAWPAPMFRTLRFGAAGYARLLASTDPAILAGADNGGQIGAWNAALDTPAENGLRLRLAEYTPFGLESGVFHVRDA